MKEYNIALRKIDEEMERVEDQIKMYATKRDNERYCSMKIILQENVLRLIGVYHGLHKAYRIIRDLEKKANKK